MSDVGFAKESDTCQVNPGNCSEGISLSLWERIKYDPDIMLKYADPKVKHGKRYLVSTGAEFDRTSGKAYPGLAIYHEGIDLVAVVSTGQEVWELRVTGQLYNDSWTNIGIRWQQPNYTDPSTPQEKKGGLEMYVNLQKVGHSLMPEYTDAGFPTYTQAPAHQIGGFDPPVMTIGCHWDYETEKFMHFGNGEYDEVADWSRRLNTNSTHDETTFFFGGFQGSDTSADPEKMAILLASANLVDPEIADMAREFLEDKLLTPAPTLPELPTRTTPKGQVASSTTEKSTTKKSGSGGDGDGDGDAEDGDGNEADQDQFSLETLAKTQKRFQDLMGDMLASRSGNEIVYPEVGERRFPVSIVAGKIVAGSDQDVVEKWDAFYKVYPHLVGAYQTVKEMHNYMLAWVGATNTSSDGSTRFFDPETNSMRYTASGEDFVLYGLKQPPEMFRSQPRLGLPNYDGIEWFTAKDKWDKAEDTFTIPTGMYKDQPGCNENPVTFIATIFNELRRVMPHRRNVANIRSGNWTVDSKIIYIAVGPNVDPMDYDADDVETVSNCVADAQYLIDNPIHYLLYHKTPGIARLVRTALSWFSEKERGGIEIRKCVYWNENFGSNGAWDTTGCKLINTDEEKTECQCSTLGAMAVISEQYEKIEIDDDCEAMIIIKYVGICFSMVFLIFFITVVVVTKSVGDMFHLVRMHVAVSWICAMVLHIATDLDQVRDDPTSNLAVGFLMMYFYTSCTMWTVCEAHATFKAFTGGIISGRTKIYFPFGYGTPLIPLGILFLLYHDDLGVDPRCFVAWNDDAKTLFLVYNLSQSFLAVVFAIIILFNMTKPQTKRRNVVSDLKSQARGTLVLCFCTFIFWIFATVTYLHNQASDAADPYCVFVVFLGWFGVVMACCLGPASAKFRNAIYKKKKKVLRM